MWLSAVSAFVLGINGGQGLSEEELRAWNAVRPSVAYLGGIGQQPAVAVCIDSRGYFLAHKSAALLPIVNARTNSGSTISLTVQETDDITQLVLLIATGPAGSPFVPARPMAAKSKVPSRLLAVLAAGPLRAEQGIEGKVGIFSEKRRLLPLTEVRFEAPSETVSGALLFSLNGELAGVLSATLPGDAGQQAGVTGFNRLQGSAQSLGGGLGGGGFAPPAAAKSYGPGTLTVAYATAPSVLQRVIEGFRTPSHKVNYPSLGILCSDAPMGGAQVRSVTPGSSAEKAGLAINDVLVELGGQKVGNQVDFARIMLEQEIGATMYIKLVRGGRELTTSALVTVTQG